MKRLATILMIISAFLFVDTTIEAKTPIKKKNKAKTTYKATNTESSPNWNENIPTPQLFIALLNDFNNQNAEMKKHGYIYDNFGTDGAFAGEYRKSGVCEIHYGVSPYTMITVTIKDKATYEKVLKELQAYIDSSPERSESYKLIEDMKQMTYHSGEDYAFGLCDKSLYDSYHN